MEFSSSLELLTWWAWLRGGQWSTTDHAGDCESAGRIRFTRKYQGDANAPCIISCNYPQRFRLLTWIIVCLHCFGHVPHDLWEWTCTGACTGQGACLRCLEAAVLVALVSSGIQMCCSRSRSRISSKSSNSSSSNNSHCNIRRYRTGVPKCFSHVRGSFFLQNCDVMRLPLFSKTRCVIQFGSPYLKRLLSPKSREWLKVAELFLNYH